MLQSIHQKPVWIKCFLFEEDYVSKSTVTMVMFMHICSVDLCDFNSQLEPMFQTHLVVYPGTRSLIKHYCSKNCCKVTRGTRLKMLFSLEDDEETNQTNLI